MVNFTIESSGFELESSIKNYTHAQDKNIDPKVTYTRGVRAVNRAFPQKNAKLTVLSESDPCFLYDFGDERMKNHGKGATKYQAMASAVMEYIERLSYFYFDYLGDPGYFKSSFNDLKRIQDVSFMERVFDVVYVDDKQKYSSIIKDIPMHWVGGYSLTKKRNSFYPVNWNNLYQSSNGLASGNTNEEAICQGICEVIERHNIGAIALKGKVVKTELIDQGSIDNPLIQSLISYLKKNNIDTYILNVVHDVDVPTIMACCIDNDPPIEGIRIGCGYGVHPDPIKAILRGITEYLQLREGWTSKDGLVKSFNLKKGNWQYRFDIDYEKIINEAPVVPVSSLPNLSNIDIREEVYSLIDVLEKKGYEVIIINKIHPKLQVPAFRIFVPGLLPGCIFTSMDQNVDMLITNLLYQGGQDERAAEYYKTHFDVIMKDFDFIEDIVKANNVNVDMSIFRSFLNPSVVPIDSICKKDYRESLQSYMDGMDAGKMKNNFNTFK